MKKFTLYWLTGDTQVVTGGCITSALFAAGIRGGAYRALDFYREGEGGNKYIWDTEKGEWVINPEWDGK